MYWSSRGKIEKAGLDGSKRHTLITGTIRIPKYLAIDFSMNRLYWSDAEQNIILSADLMGNSRRTMVFGVGSPKGLDVFKGIIYWTGYYGGSWQVYKSNMSDPGSKVHLLTTIGALYGVRVYNVQRQPQANDRCGANNGGCVQLCLPSPTGYSCLCADNEPISNETICNQPNSGKKAPSFSINILSLIYNF